MARRLGTHSSLAAVDLGSNSFRMVIADVVDGALRRRDSLREGVRLAAALGPDGRLTAEGEQRALACLARFGERLRELPPANVRAVATNTLRKARGARGFLEKARTALGHGGGVSGQEAAGISMGSATRPGQERRLVVDSSRSTRHPSAHVRERPRASRRRRHDLEYSPTAGCCSTAARPGSHPRRVEPAGRAARRRLGTAGSSGTVLPFRGGLRPGCHRGHHPPSLRTLRRRCSPPASAALRLPVCRASAPRCAGRAGDPRAVFAPSSSRLWPRRLASRGVLHTSRASASATAARTVALCRA